MRQPCYSIPVQCIDFLLQELEDAEKDHIDNTGSCQRSSQSSVVALEVVDLWSRNIFALFGLEHVLLVNGLGDVDRVDLFEGRYVSKLSASRSRFVCHSR